MLGITIAVLLDCSKSSRQCSLPYLLTSTVGLTNSVSREQYLIVPPTCPPCYHYLTPDRSVCGRHGLLDPNANEPCGAAGQI